MFGYERMASVWLRAEALRLVAERRRIEALLNVHDDRLQAARKDAKVGRAEAAGGLAVTLGGAAGGIAGNPLALAAFFGGIYLTYRSGRKAWDSAALADEIADEIAQLRQELAEIEARRNAVQSEMRSRTP